MANLEGLSYRDEFYPRGFRKIMALLLITAVSMLPALSAWQHGPVSGVAASGYGDVQVEDSGFLAGAWRIFKQVMRVFLAIVGLALYYPRWGFKRYAVICGPLIALSVPFFLSRYLEQRTLVYSVEVALVSLLAMLPGVGLYVLLTWRKAQRRGMYW